MPRVRVLPDGVVDQIAAGEVVERPASVVKELVDNALDAGAARIEIGIETAGRERVTVADDGCGMDREDALAAFERHATSKIMAAEDLARITTLGFRGEALPSIAAVSRVVLETAPSGGEGTRVRIEGGRVVAIETIARATGTTVDVRGLFYNTPARRAFLKTDATEQAAIVQRLVEHALARLDVAWRATQGRRELLALPAAQGLGERIAGLWGAPYAATLAPLARAEGGLRVRGFVQRPAAAGAGRRRQLAFVNGRPVDTVELVRATLRGYRSALPPGTRPDLFLFVEIEPAAVDVNVHPAKREVRFRDPAAVAALVEEAVRDALGSAERPFRAAARPGSYSTVGHGAPYPEDAPARRVGEPGRGQLALLFAGRRVTSAPAMSEVGDEEAPTPVAPVLWHLHRRFILAQTGKGIAIIDQHSAHERILYEESIHDLREGPRPGQRLLFPIVLDLTPAQYATWDTYRGLLSRLGFEIEPFGGQAIVVQAVPAFRHAFDAEDALAGLLDDLAEPGTGSADMNQHERVARLFACKAAIKAGAELAPEEMAELIDRLFATRLPYDDVHGRPAILQISLEDLDRHFGRH
jgi:DNA mismatch repair protein MutL